MNILKFKKNIVILLTSALLFSAPSVSYAKVLNMDLTYNGKTHRYSAEEINIRVNGDIITEYTVPPISINDRTYIPARDVFEKLGASVLWNDQERKVHISQGNNIVTLTIDSNIIVANGNNVTMDVPAMIVNDRTMIPVRYAAEALGYYVGWDNNTRTVIISENESDVVVDNNTGNNSGNNTQNPPTTDSSFENLSVVSIDTQKDMSDMTSFTIRTNSKMSEVQDFIVAGNKLVVDFYDATMKIPSSTITVDNNPYVKSIRSAQNQTTPRRITRVVFDMTADHNYSISKSGDGMSVTVSFEKNTVKSLKVNGTSGYDEVTITGSSPLAYSDFTLSSPNRVVVDIPNSTSNLDDSYSTSNCNELTDIRTGQFDSSTTRITFELPSGSDYEVSRTGNNLIIKFYKNTVTNISVNNDTIILKKDNNISASDISKQDNYISKQYKFTLPKDYTSVYGYGTLSPNSTYFSSIVVATSGGKTSITVNENKVYEYKITEDKNNIYIKAVSPRDVYDKVVVIDAGHGDYDPGTSGNGLVEKTQNLIIAKKVMNKLSAYSDIKVYSTRTGDTYMQNSLRASLANDTADLFVSIHHNYADATSANGIEVFYTPHSNEVSGKLTSKELAQITLNNLINYTGATNRGSKNDPALIVLNQTKVPAILIECGFFSNVDEASRLATDAYQEKIANAIVDSILYAFNNTDYR